MMAPKKINHMRRYRKWWAGGVVTWCGLEVRRAAPFWFAQRCGTCLTVRANARAAKEARNAGQR